MDRVPLIVVATGVVLIALLVLFLAALPWGASESMPPHAFDGEGFRAWLSGQEPDWTCETSGLRPTAEGPPAGWQQVWRVEGVRVVLTAEGHAAAEDARTAYDRLTGLVTQPIEKDRVGEGWALTVHGAIRGPVSIAMLADNVSALVQAEPVDPKSADSTRELAERMAERLVAWAQGAR